MAVRQRRSIACFSRCFGGLRTGDMHAFRWESLDTDGHFMFGGAPRKKDRAPPSCSRSPSWSAR